MKDEVKVEVVGEEQEQKPKKEKSFWQKVKEFGLKAEAKLEKGINELVDECKEWGEEKNKEKNEEEKNEEKSEEK